MTSRTADGGGTLARGRDDIVSAPLAQGAPFARNAATTALSPEEECLQPGSDHIEARVSALVEHWASLDPDTESVNDPTQLQHLIMYIRDIISPWDPHDLATRRSPFSLGESCTCEALRALALEPIDLQNMPVKAPHSPVLVNEQIRKSPTMLNLLADTVSFHLAITAVVYGRFATGAAERGDTSVQQLRHLHSLVAARILGFAEKLTWLETKGVRLYDSYFWYLSIDCRDVLRGQHHRRPGVHIDGFCGASYVENPIPNTQGIILASDFPTYFVTEGWACPRTSDGDPDYTQNWSQGPASMSAAFSGVTEPPTVIRPPSCALYALSGIQLHASGEMPADEPRESARRLFYRSEFALKHYDKVGNTVNARLGHFCNYVDNNESFHVASADALTIGSRAAPTSLLAPQPCQQAALSHPLWLLSVEKLLQLYDGTGRELEPFQVLQARGDLTEASQLTDGDEQIIFVSHEDGGTSGAQLKTMCLVLARLPERSRSWIWFDYMSMPVTHVEPPGSPERAAAEQAMWRAVNSLPGFIEKCHVFLVLVPGCAQVNRTAMPLPAHQKNLENNCFRTWRARGWCLLEAAATYLSQGPPKPWLVARSSVAAPIRLSPPAVRLTPPGMGQYTCCVRNHEFSTCDKLRVKGILEPMLDRKIALLYAEGQTECARLLVCTKHWWLGGLSQVGDALSSPHSLAPACLEEEATSSALTALRTRLRWRKEEEDDDKQLQKLLVYAVVSDDVGAVATLLGSLAFSLAGSPADVPAKLQQGLTLAGAVTLAEFSSLHLPLAEATVLMLAAWYASPAVLELLLDAGAPPTEYCGGHDAIMMACMAGHTDNVRFWLERFSDWEIDRVSSPAEHTALSLAALGRPDVGVLTLLHERGASMEHVDAYGKSILMCACSNECASPQVVMVVLNALKGRSPCTAAGSTINMQAMAGTKMNADVACSLCGEMRDAAIPLRVGFTALHQATARGDLAVVRQLLDAGADASLTSACGLRAEDVATEFGYLAIATLLKEEYSRAAPPHAQDEALHERVLRRVLFCRHGQAHHNLRNASTGELQTHLCDPELTAEGIAEAKLLFASDPPGRADFAPHVVLVSPLWRTLQTAEIAMAVLRSRATRARSLRSRSYVST